MQHTPSMMKKKDSYKEFENFLTDYLSHSIPTNVAIDETERKNKMEGYF